MSQGWARAGDSWLIETDISFWFQDWFWIKIIKQFLHPILHKCHGHLFLQSLKSSNEALVGILKLSSKLQSKNLFILWKEETLIGDEVAWNYSFRHEDKQWKHFTFFAKKWDITYVILVHVWVKVSLDNGWNEKLLWKWNSDWMDGMYECDNDNTTECSDLVMKAVLLK